MSLHHTCGAEDTWQELFDGKSLEGWRATAHPESFHIQDTLCHHIRQTAPY